MTMALCLSCGERKFGALLECNHCGYKPPDDEESAGLFCVFSDWCLGDDKFDELGNVIKEISKICDDELIKQYAFLSYVNTNHPEIIEVQLPSDIQLKLMKYCLI